MTFNNFTIIDISDHCRMHVQCTALKAHLPHFWGTIIQIPTSAVAARSSEMADWPKWVCCFSLLLSLTPPIVSFTLLLEGDVTQNTHGKVGLSLIEIFHNISLIHMSFLWTQVSWRLAQTTLLGPLWSTSSLTPLAASQCYLHTRKFSAIHIELLAVHSPSHQSHIKLSLMHQAPWVSLMLCQHHPSQQSDKTDVQTSMSGNLESIHVSGHPWILFIDASCILAAFCSIRQCGSPTRSLEDMFPIFNTYTCA